MAEELDLRGKPPPQPMVEILRLIDEGSRRDPFVVLLPHFPFPLLDELERRGWYCWTLAQEPGSVRVEIGPLVEGRRC